METINDVLYYLNEFNFTDNVNDRGYENLSCVKRVSVKELEDYKVSKLIEDLSIVDNSFFTLTVGGLQDIIKTDTLGENVLYLISFKHFVESNGKSD